MRALLALALASGGLGFCVTARADGFVVGPAVVTVDVPAGQLAEAAVFASNGTAGPLSVTTQALDWWVEDGRTVLGEAGDRPDSALPWTVLVSQEHVLAAGETYRVPIYLQPPADASGGYYVAVRVRAAPLSADGSPLGTGVSSVSLIALRIAGTGTEDLEVEEVGATAPEESRPLEVVARVTGGGDVFTELAPTALLVDAAGTTRARVDGDPVRFRPGQTKDVTLSWSGLLEPGQYTVVFSGVYGGARTLSATGTLTVPPP